MNLYETLAINNNEELTVTVPEKWGQGRATFGGMVAALMYQKLALKVESGRKVRSVTLSFVGPVAPGDMDVVVKVLRAGKGATQLQGMAYQNDQVCAVMLASFAADRESMIEVPFAFAPETKSPEDGMALPYLPGLSPDFSQYFDYRFTEGRMPFMGSEEPDIGGWIRLKEARESNGISVPEILALLDAWPPAALSMLKKPASFSSLSWNISFVNLPQQFNVTNWWQYHADIQQSQNGYSHIDSAMWDQEGGIAVISRQTASVFG